MRVTSSGSASGSVMGADALVDTGPIVALLNRADRWHDICLETFETFQLPLVTFEAAWAFHSLRRSAEIQDSELPDIHA
jgi:hypothetical protein